MFRGSRGGSGGGGGGGGGNGRDFSVSLVTFSSSPFTLSPSTTKSDFISVDSTGGGVTVNIPSPTAWSGKLIEIKDSGGSAGSNSITVSTTGSIDNQSSVLISNSYATLSLISDGVIWCIV